MDDKTKDTILKWIKNNITYIHRKYIEKPIDTWKLIVAESTFVHKKSFGNIRDDS